MKKRWISILICAACLLGVVGAILSVKTDTKVAICYRQADSVWDRQFRTELEAAMQEAGYKLEVADARNDQSLQLQQIDTMIAAGCTLLLVDPVMVAEAQTIADKAKQANVPVLFIGHQPARTVLDSWERLSFVGCDPEQAGVLQAQMVLDLPNRGDVNGDGELACIVIQGPTEYLDSTLRTESCLRTLINANVQVTVLETVSGDWTLEGGKKAAEQLLRKYGMDIEVILCNNDLMAAGAAKAVSDGGWTAGKDLYLYGIGAEGNALTLLHQGMISGTVLEDVPAQIAKITQTADLLLRKKTVEKENVIAYLTEKAP